jgi:hypothetical protein
VLADPWTDRVDFFNERRIAGLHNGLSPEENQLLFTTPHIPKSSRWFCGD